MAKIGIPLIVAKKEKIQSRVKVYQMGHTHGADKNKIKSLVVPDGTGPFRK